MTKDDIKTLYRQGSLRDVDYFLTETLDRWYKDQMPESLLIAAIASHNMINNHICLDLDRIAGIRWPATDSENDNLVRVTLPDKDRLKAILEDSLIYGSGINDESKTPLVMIDSRIYLRRYFSYEKLVAEKLLDLAGPGIIENEQVLSDKACNELLDVLFRDNSKGGNVEQIKAAKVILKNRLLIISGGPGTGKTYTLARLTAMLVAAGPGGKPPVIRMAAPTGKAAMRMRESIRDAKNDIKKSLDEIISKSEIVNTLKEKIDDIPENACTLHRLLGTIPGSTKFRHNTDNPLPADILIIDEASMIDLPMMAKIMDAMQQNTKLILLGDMHQLSSVEPGYVMGDICHAAQGSKDSDLGRSLVELTYSHRFDDDSPVGCLSKALNDAGKESDPTAEDAWTTLVELSKQGDNRHSVLLHETPKNLCDKYGIPIDDFRTVVWDNYKDLLKAKTVEEAFKAIDKFRVFSPLRNGPYGVSTINRLIEDTLSCNNMKKDDLDFTPLDTSGEFYKYRIVMIRHNNYGLKLFNGDIGIVMPEDADGYKVDIDSTMRKMVWFESTEEKSDKVSDENDSKKSYRAFPCNMIPEHDTAFAMTVHKSQGSQYKKVMVIMPNDDNEKLFTKELLYTAITRAETGVYLWCNEDVFKATACRKTECASGLVKQLTS